MVHFVFRLFQIAVVILISATITNCGGGGSSTPPPPATDVTAPLVVSTSPSSEQGEVKLNSVIEVTFNEIIANVRADMVEINPVVAGVVDLTAPVILITDPFSFDTKTKTLAITIKQAELKLNSIYQVAIHNIKDQSGNEMFGVCKWQFGTVQAAAITTGKTGVCGTDPPAVPNAPQNVNAVAGDGSVSISWQAPSAGREVTYYKIEKSIDNAQTFNVVNGNVAASTLSYTDPNAQNGTSHIYKVSAGNDIGLSNGVNSNAVTPVSTQVSVVPGTPQNVAAVARDATVTVSWSAPITGDTVAYYKVDKAVNGAAFALVKDQIPAATVRYVDTSAKNGASHVYRITAGNAIGLGSVALTTAVTPKAGIPAQARVELISQSPANGNSFGRKMAFSPDGNTLVIGEYMGDTASAIDAGTAQVFTKANGIWTRTQLLTAQTPTNSARFGYSVAISQDGAVLAVGGLVANAVDIYTKSGTRWVYAQSILPNGTTAAYFGLSVAFHPNSTLLAIGDFQASPNGVAGAGAVQLFTKSGNSWVFAQQLSAQLPAANNNFGSGVIFSPDGRILAVSELNGDPSTATDAGTVQLFTGSGGSWSLNQILISNKPTSNFAFGGNWNTSTVHFSPDSNTVAVGEYNGNNVQLFTRSGTNWNRGQVLTVATATGLIGAGVAFNAAGTLLAVGENNGTSNGVAEAGNVYLFTLSGTNWVLNRTLSATTPTASNWFGFSVFFSPVGNELAIFEYFGDTSAATDAGVVSIIDVSQLP